jgi:NADH dehydrogenase
MKPAPRPPRVGNASVVVTGADGFVGRRLMAALSGAFRHTVALVRQPCHLKASRVLAGPLDATWATEALEDADLVVHLAGALQPVGCSYRDANVATAAAVAHAVRHSAVRRIVSLSNVGASVDSSNEYLRTKAEGERVLAATGRELVVLRATHVIGPPELPGPTAEAFRARGDRPVLVPGDGTQRVAPVLLDDVVSALLAALAGGPPGTYELAGPDVMTLDDFVSLLNGGLARTRHVPARVARLAARFRPSLPLAVVDLMLRESVGDSTRAVEAFGLALHSLRESWSWQWI